MARKYRWLCESADLRVIEQRGWFLVANDLRVIRAWYRDILLSRRDNLVVQRLAREDEIDALVREMDAAPSKIEFGMSTLQVELIAEVP